MNTVLPYKDELLNSWFIRLAKVNYTTLSTILNHIFGWSKLYTRDLDLYRFELTEQETLTTLTSITNISRYQLIKFDTFLEFPIKATGRYRWILPFNRQIHLNKKREFPSIRFCSKCLREKAYLKDIWRIMLINICPKHKCYLRHECPNCKSIIRYPNKDIYQKIYECHKCRFDLRTLIQQENPSQKEINYQDKLINILHSGYFKLNNQYYYSFLLFDVIKILLRNILHINNKNDFYFLEYFTPRELSKLITYATLLLENFPNRLTRFYTKYKLTNLHAILDKKRSSLQDLPSWYINNLQYNTKDTR